MTGQEWTQVFDLVRTFIVAGVCIGLVAAIFAAVNE